MTRHDVAIVGGGPVGMLLGCLLAQRDIDVVVYEARATLPTGGRAVGILPPGIRALAAAGVEEAVRTDATVVRGGVAWSRGRQLALLRFREADAVLTLPQPALMEILRARLSVLAPDALQLGTRIRSVRQDQQGVTFAAHAQDASREGAARVLVAADGVRSGIRGDLGIPWRRVPGRQGYLMADVDDTSQLGPWAHLFIEADGIVESFPLPQQRRRWVAGVSALDADDSPSLAATVRARTGHVITAPASSAFRARQHRAARFAVGRIALVGDAAHQISPIGGQGMNLGWVGAQRLSADIITTLGQGRPDFRTYARSQQRAARRAQRRARFNMRMGAPVPRPLDAARRAATRMLGHPVFRPLLRRIFTMRGL